jgi:hypothetical protein
MDPKPDLVSFQERSATPFLVQRGFERHGLRYSAARGENTIFVQFQRRASFFTCDLGVVSALLLRELGPTPPEHWRARLGPMTVGYDRWWDLADEPDGIARDFLGALATGIERVEAIATDVGLRDELLLDVMREPGIGSAVSSKLALPLIRVLGLPGWATEMASGAST